MNRPTQSTVRCPACRAEQEWAATCRRCKCDLGLLLAAAETSRRCRRRCLDALRAGRRREAYRLARHGHWLSPDADSEGLLAVCALLRGDWTNALALAQNVPDRDRQ
jgi:hypothetical protein